MMTFSSVFQRLRGLLMLLPWSGAFSRAGIHLKLKILVYVTTFAAVGAVGWYGYWNASTAYRERAIQLLESSRDQVSANIEEFLGAQRNGLAFINNFYAIQRFAHWKDMGDAGKMEEWRAVAGDTLRNFADNYGYFYKIRFIGRDGREAIRVQADAAGGTARVAAESESQGEAAGDFITSALKLKQGQTAVSDMDFNTEQGKVEKPYVPVLRFAQPLIGDGQVLYGVTVTSVHATAIQDLVRRANRNEHGRRFYLIDAQGNFLFHAETEKEFGHLLGHGYNFDREHHNLIADMRGRAEGAITRGGHIHVFRVIYPNPQVRDRYWFLVGVVDESVALAELNRFAAVFGLLFLIVTLAVLASTRYLMKQLMAPLQFVTRQLERLGRGEVQPENLDYPARDDIQRMLVSTRQVVVNMDALTRQADAIAAGDLSGQVQLLSDHDRLGLALNNMTRQLAENHDLDLRRNWLKDGLAELTRALTGNQESQELAEKAISQIGRYLDAGRGVLYVWDAELQVLDLLGSYMYTERHALGARVRPGEGAVGQVAREMKPIILHFPGDGGDAIPSVVTGTLSVAPARTYTWPLKREGKLRGVFEVACPAALDETRLAYLDAAAEIVAAALDAVLQRQRIKELLVVAEESAHEAQEQSRRLQEANTLMEEQQQQLQQQTEELQQTNSQMEEQQQQLQQQTEELQQANAQMEEQQQQLQQQTEELQQANAQMEVQQRLLQQQTEELEQRNEELEQASRYKSDFLANMSHELRTPLNSIILLAKMLAMNDSGHLDEEEVKRAGVIQHAGGDLLTLINDILDLSKIEAGRMDVHPVLIASDSLLEDFRTQFEDTARAKGLEFELVDEWGGTFTSDRDKLGQIIKNLLSNAFKFTQGGRVTLAVRHGADPALPLCITVSDTGIGIPEDKQQIIFDAFQQVDGSISRQFGGTGLGLSISLKLAQLLGGSIQVASTLGQGSTFSLILPLILEGGRAETPEAKGMPAPAAVPVPVPLVPMAVPTPLPDDRDDIRRGDAVILVIDDDRVFGEAISQINRKQGYKTLLAGTGQEGLALARSHRPSGILLDLGLPDMDGITVLKEIKGDRALHNTPVYVVSGRDRDPGLLQEGIVGYLRKPVDRNQIVAAEEAVLEHAVKPCLVVLESGAFSVDQVRRLVGDEPVEILGATDVEAVAALYARLPCKLVLVGLESAAAVPDCVERCRALQQRLPALPILVYSSQNISSEDEAAMRGYTDSIVVDSPQAEKRVLENVERFLRDVKKAKLGAADGSRQKDRLVGRRILVVDDDARNLFVVTSALEQQGAKVENALNGRKALEILRKQPVDLIFMDVMMPDMSGYEATAAIKGDPALRAIPVVVLTAKALKNDRQDAFAAGADDYLAKPVDYDVLINMAAVWCGKKAG